LNDAQRKSICDGRIFIDRPASTNAQLKYFVEDNICSLIINVKPELKLSKDLLQIALPSSPAIANTHVACCTFLQKPFSTLLSDNSYNVKTVN